MKWLEQTMAVTGFAVRSVPQRKGTSAAAMFGIAGVVAVLVGVLSIAQGFRHAMTAAAEPDNVIVMRSGSDTEMMSGLDRAETRIIQDHPLIARSDSGPVASAELFVVINLPKRSTGTDANVPLRGVQPGAFGVRDGFNLETGRLFEPGRNEIIVGRGAAIEFAGLDLDAEITVGRNAWKVVGVFTCNGGIEESEIWTDAAVLQPAYDRGDSFQSVHLKLADPDEFTAFKDALTTDPRVQVKVVREADYYAEQSELIYRLITGLGTLIAALMGVGALFGALNTMYTAIAARTREIATLRALGFGAFPVVVSVLGESLFLAAVGGGFGALAAWFLFDGYRAATINWQSFSQVTFAFAVTPSLLIQGVVYALLIGLVGGLFPAIRAARLPIASALRES